MKFYFAVLFALRWVLPTSGALTNPPTNNEPYIYLADFSNDLWLKVSGGGAGGGASSGNVNKVDVNAGDSIYGPTGDYSLSAAVFDNIIPSWTGTPSDGSTTCTLDFSIDGGSSYSGPLTSGTAEIGLMFQSSVMFKFTASGTGTCTLENLRVTGRLASTQLDDLVDDNGNGNNIDQTWFGGQDWTLTGDETGTFSGSILPIKNPVSHADGPSMDLDGETNLVIYYTAELDTYVKSGTRQFEWGISNYGTLEIKHGNTVQSHKAIMPFQAIVDQSGSEASFQFAFTSSFLDNVDTEIRFGIQGSGNWKYEWKVSGLYMYKVTLPEPSSQPSAQPISVPLAQPSVGRLASRVASRLQHCLQHRQVSHLQYPQISPQVSHPDSLTVSHQDSRLHGQQAACLQGSPLASQVGGPVGSHPVSHQALRLPDSPLHNRVDNRVDSRVASHPAVCRQTSLLLARAANHQQHPHCVRLANRVDSLLVSRVVSRLAFHQVSRRVFHQVSR